jgi:E3 ubiquitin-protein ligase RNF14
MIDCGHVFCVQCLQDFYNNAINEGDLVSVRCLDPGCAKKREDAQSPKKRRKAKTLSPSELLQIPLAHDMVTRYVKLKHKADLESDKNTIYCPRKWCQGAARSKKHRKPEGLEVVESDDESEVEDGTKKDFTAGKDLLSVCEDCSFAFCCRCYSSWHGEFKSCGPRRDTGELTEEEKASFEYLKLHTTPCPTCAAPAQKTHGCNHMICFKCNSHFCYLCSAWLEPDNPYKHYNMEKTSCYMRLWELEGGDGDDVGIGYVGGVQEYHAEIDNDREDEAPPREEARVLPPDPADRQIIAPGLPDPPPEVPPAALLVPAPPLQELQREGPLVLRINQIIPLPLPVVPNPPVQLPQWNFRALRGGRRVHDHRPPAFQQAAPLGGRRQLIAQAAGAAAAAAEAAAEAREVAHQEWVRRFVELALNDEEDQLEWDSDDEEDAAAWAIPVR